ncbi:MAG: ImmA/IrrE family metallo-endopeptidase [Clostridiales bacterium]|jgi:Zn-dependent peptidase ImmA (M78 family)|nr:ImmA/IrrE family metallo-endopeptidase [Clostridiales bacterium]
MFYKKYCDTRDASWDILIRCRAGTLPIKIVDVCKRLKIKVFPYTDAFLKLYNIDANRTDGFCVLIRRHPVIFYNPNTSKARQRFTIAHELGHIVRGHLDTRTMVNREPDPQDSPEEYEANIFASRLLAPACVLWGCRINTPEEIAEMCDISMTSARFRMERMAALYERERRFYAKYGKSCFLQSPLEQRVYAHFKKYIEEYTL